MIKKLSSIVPEGGAHVVARMKGNRDIIMIETPRTASWWKGLPSHGSEDATCLLLHKVGFTKSTRRLTIMSGYERVLKDWASQITEVLYATPLVFSHIKMSADLYRDFAAAETVAIKACQYSNKAHHIACLATLIDSCLKRAA